MNRHPLTALVSALILSIPAYTSAQNFPTHEQVAAWFAEEWRRATSPVDLQDCVIHWRSVLAYVPPAAELAKMRAAVAGKPEHPDRHLIAMFEDRLKNGPTTISKHFCADGHRGWRFGETYSSGKYCDTVATPNKAWQLFPPTLKLLDASKLGSRDPEQDVTQLESTFLPEVGLLLFGGLSYGKVSNLEPGPITLDGAKWSVDAGLKGEHPPQTDFAMRFYGHWDSAKNRGFVDGTEIIRSGFAPQTIGDSWTISDWQLFEEANLHAAKSAVYRRSNGVLDRSLTLVGINRIDGGFNAAIAVPSRDEPDVFRGIPLFTSMADYRTRTVSDTTPEGVINTRPLGGLPPPPGRATLDVVGYVILFGLLFATVVMWRIYHRP